MKLLLKLSLTIILIFFVNITAQVTSTDYLSPVSGTIKSNGTIDIFGRITITGVTSQLGNTSQINASLVLANANLTGQNDPRYYSAATFTAVFNQMVNSAYEYKATVHDMPVGDYNYCYYFNYGGQLYYGWNYGDGRYFYVGTLHVTSATGIEKSIGLPDSYNLSQNYPNPFNPSTTIKFSLPKDEFVTLKIYDMLGKEVMTVVNEEKSAGNYEVNIDAKFLTSGIYLYKLAAGDFVQTKKMILLK